MKEKEKEKTEKEREKEKHMFESIGHWPVQGHCPKRINERKKISTAAPAHPKLDKEYFCSKQRELESQHGV